MYVVLRYLLTPGLVVCRQVAQATLLTVEVVPPHLVRATADTGPATRVIVLENQTFVEILDYNTAFLFTRIS